MGVNFQDLTMFVLLVVGHVSIDSEAPARLLHGWIQTLVALGQEIDNSGPTGWTEFEQSDVCGKNAHCSAGCRAGIQAAK